MYEEEEQLLANKDSLTMEEVSPGRQTVWEEASRRILGLRGRRMAASYEGSPLSAIDK